MPSALSVFDLPLSVFICVHLWFHSLVCSAANLSISHSDRISATVFGSRKHVARGPRIIDLDILFYGASVIRTEEMEIPHPRMDKRRFVLVPLAELAPALRHPVLGATIAELIAAARDKSAVRLWQQKGSGVH